MRQEDHLAAPAITKSNVELAFREATEYMDAGQHDIAGQIYQEILQVQPKHAFSLLGLADIARMEKQFDNARAYAKRALQAQPNHPAALSLLGVISTDVGEHEKAESYFRQAVTAGPKSALCAYNLGHFYLERKRYELAEKYLKKTIVLERRYFSAYKNLGVLKKATGDYKDALKYFKKAYEIDNEGEKAALCVSSMEMVMGDIEETEKYARIALDVYDAEGEAYLRLADIKRLNSDDVRKMTRLAKVFGIPKSDQAEVCYALGKYYDDRKQYAKAFKYYKKANKIKRKIASPNQDRMAERLTVNDGFFFTPEFFKNHEGWGSDSRKPFFVVGMPRSGTSLVEQIISGHDQVDGAGELDFMHDMVINMKNLSFANGKAYPQCLDAIGAEDAQQLAESYLAVLNSRFADSQHVIDKLPINSLYVGLIRLLFPHAKIVNCYRHPLDVCLSIYFQNFSVDHYYACKLEDVAVFYKQYLSIMKKWQEILPGFVHHVFHEELINNPQSTIRRMMEFCELPWQKQCVDSHKNVRPVATASAMQVREPIYETVRYRWKNYKWQVRKIRKILKEEIRWYEEQVAG